MREITNKKNSDSLLRNQNTGFLGFNKGAPNDIVEHHTTRGNPTHRPIKLLQRLGAGLLATTMLFTSADWSPFSNWSTNLVSVFAAEDTSGDTTNEAPDPTSVAGLTGGETFTELGSTSAADVTNEGMYVYQSDNDYYFMFTNKRAVNENFYRTIGFNIHPHPSQDLSKDDQAKYNFSLDQCYPSSYPSDRKLVPTEGLTVEYGAPGASSLNNNPNHAISHGSLTTTCFKLSKDSIQKFFEMGAANSTDPKIVDAWNEINNNHKVYMSAIQTVYSKNNLTKSKYDSSYINNGLFNNYVIFNPNYKEPEKPSWRFLYIATESFNQMYSYSYSNFSSDTTGTMHTYYNIPLELAPKRNATTYIAVDANGKMEVIKTENDEQAWSSGPYSKEIGKTIDFGGELGTYTTIGFATIPYGAINAETSDKARNQHMSELIKWSDAHGYSYPSCLDYLQAETSTYLNKRYDISYLKSKTGSAINNWYTAADTDTIKFDAKQYVTKLPETSKYSLTNTSNITGTQYYVFVNKSDTVPSEGNIVFYNDATGQPLATGEVNYQLWSDTLYDRYEKSTTYDRVTDEGVKYFEFAGNTSSPIIKSIKNYNLNNVEAISTTPTYAYAFDTSYGDSKYEYLTMLKEKRDAAINVTSNMHTPYTLTTVFPKTLTDKKGNKLVYKGAEVVFNTTVDEDISKTASKAHNTIPNVNKLSNNIKNLLVEDKTIAKKDPGYEVFDKPLIQIKDDSGNILENSYAILPKDSKGYISGHNFYAYTDEVFDSFKEVTKGIEETYVTTDRHFTMPILATYGIHNLNITTDNRGHSTYNSGYGSFSFSIRYGLWNLPYNIYTVAQPNKKYTVSRILSLMQDDVLYLDSKDFSKTMAVPEQNKHVPTGKENLIKKTEDNSTALVTTDFRDQDNNGGAVVSFNNLDDYKNQYIVRVVYEPATIPVIYYLKNGDTPIQVAKLDTTPRLDKTIVKDSIKLNGKRWYTKNVSYRTNTTQTEDITKTQSSTDIMVPGIDQKITPGIELDTSGIDESTSYVVRVELGEQPPTISNSDYEMGTFEIPAQQLSQNFSYKSMENIGTTDGLNAGKNVTDDNSKINKVGIISPALMEAHPEYKETYNPEYDKLATVHKAINAQFDHSIFTTMYRAHNNGSTEEAYKSNFDGDPFTGATTKSYTYTSGDDEVTAYAPCKETVELKFSSIRALWSKDKETVFGGQLDDLIMNNSNLNVSDMGVRSANTDGKSEDSKSYVRLGSYLSHGASYKTVANGGAFSAIDTDNNTVESAQLAPGLVKTYLSMNFTSSKSAFGFKPTLASYSGQTLDNLRSVMKENGYESYGTDYFYSNKVENPDDYNYSSTSRRITANVTPDDSVEFGQRYSVRSTHDVYKADDRDENISESDDIETGQIDRGIFGGWMTVKAIPDVTRDVVNPKPLDNSDNNPNTFFADVPKQLILYPSFKMTTNTGTPVDVLSPVPIYVNTRAKLWLQDNEEQDILSLKAIFTRGKDKTIAAGSAYQYLASGQLERKIVIKYVVANPDYISNAEDYNTEVENGIETLIDTLRKPSNYEVNTLTNIPYAGNGSNVERYKVSFGNNDPTAVKGPSQNAGSDPKLIDIDGIKAQFKTGNIDGWYKENSDIINNAVSLESVTITVKHTPKDSNTVVAHLNLNSNSTENNKAPYANNDTNYVNKNNANKKSDGSFIIDRGSQPYDFGTAVQVRIKPNMQQNVKFFGTPINFEMHSKPVYFKVQGTAYDYRE